MKRSEINKCIKEFEARLKEHRFELPPFLTLSAGTLRITAKATLIPKAST